MQIAEFFQTLKGIADGRYFTCQLNVSPNRIEWNAYIEGPGWTGTSGPHPCDPKDPVSVLGAMALMKAHHVFPPPPEVNPAPAGLAELGDPAIVPREPGAVIDAEFPEIGEQDVIVNAEAASADF